MLRMIVFLAIVTTILVGGASYVGWRLIGPSPLVGAPRVLAWAGVFAAVLLQPLSFALRGRLPAPFDEALAWLSYSVMGLFSLVFTFTVLRDLGWLALKGAHAVTPVLPEDPARRQALLHGAGLAVLGASGVLGAAGFRSAVRRAAVVDVSVPIAGLPAALEGFRIVQVTDIHVGPTIKRGFLQAIVDAVNTLDADVVAVTGDLVDGSVAQLREHVAPLGQLKAKHGAYFVTGNHEYYSGAQQWVAEVRRLGLSVLLNENRVLEHGGAKLMVAGVTDFNAAQVDPSHATDPAKAARTSEDVDVRVLLAHQPRSAFLAAKAGFDLQISGHTHGGQFFPWNFFVRLQQPFTAGLHKLEDLWVYTSRGTGYWGPPIRLMAPSEITRITLTRA